MKNILRVLKRDFLRILKTPAAFLVVVFLIILPSVYTLYNVAGFWDPYENTGNLRVCVVNQDEGATSDLTGELDVGSQIVEKLSQNDQLGWYFTDFDTAMDELERGASYAVYVIPPDFTKRLLTVIEGDYQRPVIQYYVNEKTGPVSPKVTDAGATALDESVNSAFVSAVSDAIVTKIDEVLSSADVKVDATRTNAVAKIDEALAAVNHARTSIGNVNGAATDAQANIAAVRADLDTAQANADAAQTALSEINTRILAVQSTLNAISDTSAPAIESASSTLGELAASTADASAKAAAAAGEAQGAAQSAIARAEGVVQQNNDLIESLQAIYSSLPADDPNRELLAQAIADLQAKNASLESTVAELSALESHSEEFAQQASTIAGDINRATGAANGALADFSRALYATSIPAVNASLVSLSVANGSLMSFVSSQSLMAGQVRSLLNQLESTLGTSSSALSATDALLASLVGDLSAVRTDILSLSRGNMIADSLGVDSLDPERISSFMESPTLLVTEQLYPVESYGAAMVPLFMNLTCWIGAFMLLVIFRQEVDGEGIKKFTLTQRYVSRFLLFGILAILQALVCVTGVVAMGVNPVSITALAIAAMLTSLSYLSIIYALSITFQHVGKGLCLLLVFAQIPGATGLYPIETTPPFFQAIYPFLPFTYGIGAMREALCGFYGNQYWFYMAMLALFLVVAMIFGIALRRPMANVNRMFAEEIKKTGVYNIDAMDIPLRSYRITQIIRALSDKEEYRRAIELRYRKFMDLRPQLVRWSIALVIILPVALTIVFSASAADKVVLLTLWVVLFVLAVIAVVVVKGFRYSLERQMKMDAVSDEELIKLGASQNDVESLQQQAGGAHA